MAIEATPLAKLSDDFKSELEKNFGDLMDSESTELFPLRAIISDDIKIMKKRFYTEDPDENQQLEFDKLTYRLDSINKALSYMGVSQDASAQETKASIDGAKANEDTSKEDTSEKVGRSIGGRRR